MLPRLSTTVLLLPAMLLACIAALPPVTAAEDLAKIDLARVAQVFASHATPGEEFKIDNAIDGDPATKWVGESHPLSFQPANIVSSSTRRWSCAAWCWFRSSSARSWR